MCILNLLLFCLLLVRVLSEVSEVKLTWWRCQAEFFVCVTLLPLYGRRRSCLCLVASTRNYFWMCSWDEFRCLHWRLMALIVSREDCILLALPWLMSSDAGYRQAQRTLFWLPTLASSIRLGKSCGYGHPNCVWLHHFCSQHVVSTSYEHRSHARTYDCRNLGS